VTPAFVVFTYFVTWCITLFMVLPFRLKKWWYTAILNTFLAALITLSIYFLLKSGLVPLRYAY